MNGIEKLNRCCDLRGNPRALIHRTIHEFDWFMSAVIFGEQSESKQERELYKKYKDFYYTNEHTLNKWINIFYEYCKEYYQD